MQRMAIVGNAGGGKSTLARPLGAKLDLPMYPMEPVQWLPGWVPAPQT
jgi:adenylate kinase family enzyme